MPQVDVVKKILRASKNVIANPILTTNKDKKRLRPIGGTHRNAFNFLGPMQQNLDPNFTMARTILLNQLEGSPREHEGEDERTHQREGVAMVRRQMQQV